MSDSGQVRVEQTSLVTGLTWSLVEISAPDSRSRETTSRRPSEQARLRGVLPFSSRASVFAPAVSITDTTLT
jgi:hypothetical protein